MGHQNIDIFWDELEWEILNKPIELIKSFDISRVYSEFKDSLSGLNQINISRDDKYNLIVVGKGTSNEIVWDISHENNKIIPGTILQHSIIKGQTSNMQIVELNPCYIHGLNSNYSMTESIQSTFTVSIVTYKIVISNVIDNNINEKKTLVEWFLNAPKNSFMYSEVTKKETNVNVKCKKSYKDEKSYQLNKTESASLNCIYIQYNDNGFLINKVNDRYSPDWSGKLSIEYREEFGRIPDEKERQAISEFIGFIIGRNISLIGNSLYSDSGYIIEAMACNPNVFNLSVECQHSAREIIPIHHNFDDGLKFKKLLESLLPKYLKQMNMLGLDDGIQQYWLASAMPLGVNLPILSSGLEIIMNNWFKTQKSNSKGVYLPHKDYTTKKIKIMQLIDELFIGNPYIDRIKNKIEYLNQMGANEKFEIFFEEIGLKYGDNEREAVKSRNIFAHGTYKLDENKMDILIKNTNTYFILFSKIILQLLDYNGEYIDSTILGYPKKNISEIIGIER